MKKFLALALLVFVVWVVFFFPLVLRGNAVRLEIPSGTSARQVSSLLQENKLVLHRYIFRGLVIFTFSGSKIQAGIYEFVPPLSPWMILKKLKSGDTVKVKITVPEGSTAEQIAQLVEEQGLGKAKHFLAIVKKRSLEGYLFPDTYFFKDTDREETVIARMLEEFRSHFTPEFQEQAKVLKMTERQIVTLASIIEREARVPEERPIISSVYHNRLKKRMPLEADPTVQYALGRWKERLYYKHLNVDSPYNTYRHPGLPPGPICSPGLDSLKAALYPAQTDYLFFVADGTGRHQFTKTLAEHNRAKHKKP